MIEKAKAGVKADVIAVPVLWAVLVLVLVPSN